MGQARECYRGFFGSSMKDAELEYAYQYVEETGLLSDVRCTLEKYFDYARELFSEGYSDNEGHIFADY